MSRNLPAIDYGGAYVSTYSPRKDGASSRLDFLEDRIVVQERTTNALLDKAYKIKNDVIDSMNMTHGTWQDEKNSRSLLQEHIRTITDVVKRLGRDISILEEQIQLKQGNSESTSRSVKNLEVQQVATLTDLRGRIARCDASIAKLASDVKTCYDSIRTSNLQHNDQMNKLMDRFQGLDNKMSDILLKLERSTTDYQIKIRTVEGDTGQQLTSLDARTRGLVEETRTAMNSYKLLEEAEREKLETRISTHLERITSVRDVKQDKYEKRIEDQFQILTKRLIKLEDSNAKERDRVQNLIQGMENKLYSSMESNLQKQQEENARLKRECREGFATVHESITNMKQVMEGKRKLLEEQIRKEVGQIRKMVVLI